MHELSHAQILFAYQCACFKESAAETNAVSTGQCDRKQYDTNKHQINKNFHHESRLPSLQDKDA